MKSARAFWTFQKRLSKIPSPVHLKSAGDSDTNAHLCHIGGADFLLLGARWQGGVQSVREGVQLTEYLQIKPKLIHFT